MDRSEFSMLIGDDNQVLSMFDEIMALYNIVSESYDKASLSEKTDSTASFVVSFKTDILAKTICELIDGRHTTIYNTDLLIESIPVSGNNIKITMTRK